MKFKQDIKKPDIYFTNYTKVKFSQLCTYDNSSFHE